MASLGKSEGVQMALKKLPEEMVYIAKARQKIKELELILRDLEAVLYEDEDEDPPDKAEWISPVTGKAFKF